MSSNAIALVQLPSPSQGTIHSPSSPPPLPAPSRPLPPVPVSTTTLTPPNHQAQNAPSPSSRAPGGIAVSSPTTCSYCHHIPAGSSKRKFWSVFLQAAKIIGALITTCAAIFVFFQYTQDRRRQRWTLRNDFLETCRATEPLERTLECNQTIDAGPKMPPIFRRDRLFEDYNMPEAMSPIASASMVVMSTTAIILATIYTRPRAEPFGPVISMARTPVYWRGFLLASVVQGGGSSVLLGAFGLGQGIRIPRLFRSVSEIDIAAGVEGTLDNQHGTDDGTQIGNFYDSDDEATIRSPSIGDGDDEFWIGSGADKRNVSAALGHEPPFLDLTLDDVRDLQTRLSIEEKDLLNAGTKLYNWCIRRTQLLEALDMSDLARLFNYLLKARDQDIPGYILRIMQSREVRFAGQDFSSIDILVALKQYREQRNIIRIQNLKDWQCSYLIREAILELESRVYLSRNLFWRNHGENKGDALAELLDHRLDPATVEGTDIAWDFDELWTEPVETSPRVNGDRLGPEWIMTFEQNLSGDTTSAVTTSPKSTPSSAAHLINGSKPNRNFSRPLSRAQAHVSDSSTSITVDARDRNWYGQDRSAEQEAARSKWDEAKSKQTQTQSIGSRLESFVSDLRQTRFKGEQLQSKKDSKSRRRVVWFSNRRE